MLKYIARIENETEYYIERNFKTNDLMKLYKEIEEAEVQLKEYKQRIMDQYNKATQVVERIIIVSTRVKNDYSRDKKVKIRIQVRKIKLFEGVEVANDYIYSGTDEFSYQDKTKALLYVYDMLDKYPGSRYHNETTYKFMEV